MLDIVQAMRSRFVFEICMSLTSKLSRSQICDPVQQNWRQRFDCSTLTIWIDDNNMHGFSIMLILLCLQKISDNVMPVSNTAIKSLFVCNQLQSCSSACFKNGTDVLRYCEKHNEDYLDLSRRSQVSCQQPAANVDLQQICPSTPLSDLNCFWTQWRRQIQHL